MVETLLRKVVCPGCKETLIRLNDNLVCDKCNAVYPVYEKYIDLLFSQSCDDPYGDPLVKEQKDNEKRDYTIIAQSLDQAGIGRFSTFLNYGYVGDDNRQYAAVDPGDYCLNLNSIKLLLEVVGHTNLYHREVLDIGCGRGGNISALRKYFKPLFITGLDICTANIEFCSSRNRLDEVAFLVGDAERIPFANESVDVVLNMESAHAYPDRQQFYEEVYRILRPGGVFLYSELMPGVLVERNMLLLTQIGFVLTRNQNATSNVLLSCDDNEKQRTGAQGIAKQTTGINEYNDFMALPGSNKYNDMKQGVLEYRIMTLIKPG